MSVSNKQQAQSALNYFTLWQSKYSAEKRVTDYNLSQCESFCLGYLVGFIRATDKVTNTKSEHGNEDGKDNSFPST